MRSSNSRAAGYEYISGDVGRFIIFGGVVLAIVILGLAAGAPATVVAESDEGVVTIDDQTITNESVLVTVTDEAEAGNVITVWKDGADHPLGSTTLTDDASGAVRVDFDEPIESSTATLVATINEEGQDTEYRSAATYSDAFDTASVTVAADPSTVESGPIAYASSPDGNEITVEVVFEEGNYEELSADQITVYDRDEGTDLATSEPTISGPDDNTVRLELDTDERLSPGATMELLDTTFDIETTASTIDEDGSDETFVGETVAIVGEENEVISIETPETSVERGLGEGSEVRTLETRNYEPGDEITVTFESSGQTVSVELEDLGLQAETAERAYWDDETILATATADRIDREIAFTLQDDSGEPVDDEHWYTDRLNFDGEATAAIDIDSFDPDPGIYTVLAKDVTSSTIADSTPIIITESTDATPSFDRSTYSQYAGDIVEFTIDTHGQYFTQVDLTDSESGWSLSFMIHDPEQDKVDVEFNTYYAGGHAAQAISSEDARITEFAYSAKEVDDVSPTDSQFELATHFPAADTSDEANIDLKPPTTDNISTYVAPASQVEPDDDIETIRNKSTQRATVTQGDLLIIELQATGIFGGMVDGSELNPGADPTLSMTRVDEWVGGDTSYRIGGDNVPARAIPDPEAGTLFVIVDESTVEAVDAGESWEVAFERESSGPLITHRLSTPIDIEERSIELAGDRHSGQLAVANAQEAPIDIDTNVAPGTELELSLRFPRELQQTSTNVGDDGYATAYFDLSGYDEGSEILAIDVLDVDGSIVDSEPGVVVDSDEGMQSSIDVEAPRSVNADENASIDVTVSNEGPSGGVTELKVSIGGETVASKPVDLEPDESKSFEFGVDTSTAGTIDWSAATDREGEEGVIEVMAESDGVPGFSIVITLIALFGSVMFVRHRLS